MSRILFALTAACVILAAVIAAFAYLKSASRLGDGADAGSASGAEEPAESRTARGGAAQASQSIAAAGAPGSQASSARPNPRGTGAGGKQRGEDESVAHGALPIPRGDAALVFELADSAGKPITDASVTLLRGRGAQTAACDGIGAAAFIDIEAGTYTFTVEAAGIPELVSAKEISLAPREERRVPLTIDAYALSISGRVLDRSGTPVRGVTVRARRQVFQAAESDLLRSDQETLESRSGPDGRYEIRGLDAADYAVHAEATDGYPAVSKVYRAGTRSADIVLEESRLLAVHGAVTSRDGRGIAGARLLPQGQTTRQAETDAAGRYQLELELTEGQPVQVITANKDGYRDARVNVRTDEVGEEDGLELNLVMDSLGVRASVSGSITDADRNPVNGEFLYLQSATLNARYQAVSDARGRFALNEVQVGSDYRLSVYPRQGFKDFLRSPVEVPEAGAELEIVLEPIESGKLHGVMVDALGAPVPSFTLWLRSLKAQGNSIAVTGNEAGRFEADSVPEGDLRFETRSAPRLTVLGIQLAAASDPELKLVLDWGALAFSGSVTDEAGAPVAGASVSLYWAERIDGEQSSSFRSTVTDASGKFTFSELGPGEHKVSVSASGYAPAQVTYEVGSGAAEPVIRLKAKAQR